MYGSYFNKTAETKGIINMPSNSAISRPLGGHAILFVGYNDNTRMLKFRNSYGSGWGDRGYGYLPYDYVTHPANIADDFWILKARDA